MRRLGSRWLVLAVTLAGILTYGGDTAPNAQVFVIPGATFRISGEFSGGTGLVPLPGASRDPALVASYDRIRALLESAYPDSYASLFADEVNHLIVVYRRPDPALDGRVRAEFPAVPVVFVDARFSRNQLGAFARLILRDKDYWRGLGVTVEAVADGATGEGVDVLVAAGARADAERLMNEHYGDIPIRVRGG